MSKRKTPSGEGPVWLLITIESSLPLTDNQSEYSVGSEEEDEDFDERPEGGVFLDFLSLFSHFTF
jgi:hypothetical protein